LQEFVEHGDGVIALAPLLQQKCQAISGGGVAGLAGKLGPKRQFLVQTAARRRRTCRSFCRNQHIIPLE